VLEFFNNIWGPETKEKGSRTGPPGYIGWRNRFLGSIRSLKMPPLVGENRQATSRA
jgi:hypothetical protein